MNDTELLAMAIRGVERQLDEIRRTLHAIAQAATTQTDGVKGPVPAFHGPWDASKKSAAPEVQPKAKSGVWTPERRARMAASARRRWKAAKKAGKSHF